MLNKTTSQKRILPSPEEIYYGPAWSRAGIEINKWARNKGYAQKLHSEFPMTGYLDNERSATGYLDLSVN